VNFGEPISGHCEATSISFGMNVKRLAGGPAHSAQTAGVHLIKELDSLSRKLFLNASSGARPFTVTIEIWQTGKAPTLIYTLTNASILAYLRHDQGGTESVSLGSESISHRYFSLAPRSAPPAR
jgi:type VI protein secretion system component Hcp